MLRPGSAIKRKTKAVTVAPTVSKVSSELSKQVQNEMKLPEVGYFLKKRDFIAALALLECDRKYSRRHDLRTYLGIAYCAYHNGDYK